MAIIRWQAPGGGLDELERLHREMDKVFSGFSPTSDPFFSRAYPAVNITEDANNFYVRGELPGIKNQDLDISVEDDRLTIRGERALAPEDKAASYHRREREGGFFRRIIALPVRVDSNKVTATIKNGVFTITLPKPPEKKPRTITVKSS
jgi:HSP20 family protein